MDKNKLVLPISILLGCFVLGTMFYWYEWRPAQIKHDCSWVKWSLPAALEITQKQYDECAAEKKNKYGSNEGDKIRLDISLYCNLPRPAQSATDGWEKASKQEYDFCIHDKGL